MMTTQMSTMVQAEFDTYLKKQYLSGEELNRLGWLAYVLGVTVTIKRTYFSSGQVQILTLPGLDNELA